jgi:hypothetical protein
MDLLQYFPRPRVRRRLVERVATSVAPGGALLITSVLRPPHVEDARWTRWLPVSARADAALFRERGLSLALEEERLTDRHLVSLFRASAA